MCIVDPFLLQSEYLLAIRELPPLFGGREAVKDKRNRESNHEKYVVKRFVKGPKTGEKKKLLKADPAPPIFIIFIACSQFVFPRLDLSRSRPRLYLRILRVFFFLQKNVTCHSASCFVIRISSERIKTV